MKEILPGENITNVEVLQKTASEGNTELDQDVGGGFGHTTPRYRVMSEGKVEGPRARVRQSYKWMEKLKNWI